MYAVVGIVSTEVTLLVYSFVGLPHAPAVRRESEKRDVHVAVIVHAGRRKAGCVVAAWS